MPGTRNRRRTSATALILLFGVTGGAEAATLRMSGDWWLQRGSVAIPVVLAFGSGGAAPGIPGSGFVSVTNPDSSGPATIVVAPNIFGRDAVSANFPLPGPTLVQLWTSFANLGPVTTTGASGPLPTPSASINKLQPALSAKRPFANFAFCPGATANPSCVTHKTVGQGATPGQGTQHGIIKYTAATPQFGGTMRIVIAGTGSFSVAIGATPKFSHALVGGGGADQVQVVGGHYAGTDTDYLAAGVRTTGAVTTEFGAIASPGVTLPPPSGTGTPATNRNVGMPWTVGNVYAKVTVTNGAGITTVSTMGYDSRSVNGRGNIMLVAMGLTAEVGAADSFISIDRVRLDISSGQLTPSLSPTGALALGVLLVLTGGYAVRRHFG